MSEKSNSENKPLEKFSAKVSARALFIVLFSIGFFSILVGKAWQQHSLLRDLLNEGNKPLYSGLLYQSRISAALEQVESSVSSRQSNEEFTNLLEKILEESKASPDIEGLVRPIKKIIEGNSKEKAQLTEDLQLSFRNMKTIAFNIYRLSWNYKWMNVAKFTGLIIGDLDNYSAVSGGETLVSNMYTRITQITKLVTGSGLAADQKLLVFSNLNGLKSQVQKYSQILAETKSVVASRKEVLTKVLGSLQTYIQDQSRGLDRYTSISYNNFLQAVALLFFYAFSAFFLSWALVSRGAGAFAYFASEMDRIVNDWLENQLEKNPKPNQIDAQTVMKNFPKSVQNSEVWDLLKVFSGALNRVSSMKLETAFVLKNFQTPFLLVASDKKAVYWNSALTTLLRARSKDELGAIHYRSLITVQDATGRVIDPYEKATEGKYFLRIGTSLVPVYVKSNLCGDDEKYMLIQLTDLREESQRIEAEFDQQLKWVAKSIEKLHLRQSPALSEAEKMSTSGTIRKQVLACIASLDRYHVGLEQRIEILKTQVEVMQQRISKDSNLKEKTVDRIESLSKNVFDLETKNHEMSQSMGSLLLVIEKFSELSKLTNQKIKGIQVTGKSLTESIKQANRGLMDSITKIEKIMSLAEKLIATKNYLHNAMEEMNVSHANACIIGSKEEVSPRDIRSFVETLNRIHSELGEMYGVFEDSLKEISIGVKTLNADVRKSLNLSSGIFSQNEGVLKGAFETEKYLKNGESQLNQIQLVTESINKINSNIQNLFTSFEERIKILSQMGDASLMLHSQVESGLDDLKGQVLNFK